ncbi:uncharacterized protein LOC105435041 isoform X2 [Cucumis sativus]|uniref:Uncharacterized protein n=1 Tax=Cucumis sativus TaxID=3659 RepID=A0A0A0LEC6_CUCSA|nr:uncharacterized protein LOC105435041 isoform X2 [Cucumis sativus]KGN60390.1 hypothetical protein Csa_002670 [Cucumis sativus]
MEDDDNPKLFPHPQRHSSSSSSMTLFSRLDHLDFVMKELEKKQRLERLFGESNLEEGMGGRSISMDVALKDTYSKGSLLDRVAALEHRLLQLCLEMESGSSSNPSSLTTSSQTSSSLEITSSSSPKKFCNGQTSSSSYPTFHYPNNGTTSQVSQFQEKPQRQQQKKKQQSTPKGQVVVGKTMTEKDEVGSCKNVKKGNNPSAFKWPHLRMFGC